LTEDYFLAMGRKKAWCTLLDAVVCGFAPAAPAAAVLAEKGIACVSRYLETWMVASRQHGPGHRQDDNCHSVTFSR